MKASPPPGSHALLLTACIAPKPDIAGLLKRSDPAQRLADYAASLRFWLRLADPRIGAIVFVDNSGHPLDALQTLAARENLTSIPVEFHSFDYPAPPPTLNYGHPEMRMINEVLGISEQLSRLPWFAKVTGRYHYPAFSRLLDRLPHDYRVAVDTTGMRPAPWRRLSNPISLFALAFFQTEFYRRHLQDIPDRMRPAPPWDRRQFVEPMIHDTLYPMRKEPGIIMRWPCNCEPRGIGANGQNYRAPRRRAVSFIRAVARRLCPSFWI